MGSEMCIRDRSTTASAGAAGADAAAAASVGAVFSLDFVCCIVVVSGVGVADSDGMTYPYDGTSSWMILGAPIVSFEAVLEPKPRLRLMTQSFIDG